MQIVHYIMIVAGSLGAALPVTAKAFPANDSPYFLGVAAVCVLVATVSGAVSDKIQLKGSSK